jgi:GNAT superfamily N-acetyltransferase
MAVVTIEELDRLALDDGTLAQLAELSTIEEHELAPGDPPVEVAEEADELRVLPSFEELVLWVARDPDGRLLGRATLEIEHREENHHLAEVALVVRPEARRRGIGGRLLLAVGERARAAGRTTLVTYGAAGRDGAAAALALGAEAVLDERISRLRPAELDRPLLQSWVDRASERAGGYSLVAWDGACPDELLEHFASIMAVMNTAPRGDVDMEDEVFTPELIRDFEASLERKGTVVWTVAARHDATGQLAGYTALFFPKHRPWYAEQGDTGVDPAHRDKGLGRWLKAANLLRLLDERPAVQAVDTGNATSNEPMLNINVALGFRPLVEIVTLQLKL